jgi:hypothetical protein
LYFAYGSNLNSAHFSDWLDGKGLTGVGTKLEKVSYAYLAGYRLGFTRRSTKWEAGVADVVKAKGERVWGVVFCPTEGQCGALDQKERVSSGAYKRHEVLVQYDKETPGKDPLHPCTTYVVVKREASLQVLNPEYLKIIQDGGKKHGLPQEFFDHLTAASVTERNFVAIRINDISGMQVESE